MKRLVWAIAAGLLVATATGSRAATLDEGALTQLVKRCAPQVSPTTMLALIAHESGGDPYAIGVNGTPRQTLHPKDAAAAAKEADALLHGGKSVDLGLGQINSANLTRLQLTATTAFDSCKNIAAAAKLLTQAYVRVRPTASSDQAALDAALSTYNTGSPEAGVVNGYVALVRNQYTVPALGAEPAQPAAVSAQRTPAPAWDVYGSARQAEPRQPAKPAAASTAVAPAEPVMVFEQGS